MSKVIFSESFCFPDVVNCFPFATASKLWQNNLLANTKKSHMWHNYQSISLLCFVLMHLCLNKIFPCLCKPFLGSYGLVSTPLVASAHAQEPCIAAVLLHKLCTHGLVQSRAHLWRESLLCPHTLHLTSDGSAAAESTNCILFLMKWNLSMCSRDEAEMSSSC